MLSISGGGIISLGNQVDFRLTAALFPIARLFIKATHTHVSSHTRSAPVSSVRRLLLCHGAPSILGRAVNKRSYTRSGSRLPVLAPSTDAAPSSQASQRALLLVRSMPLFHDSPPSPPHTKHPLAREKYQPVTERVPGHSEGTPECSGNEAEQGGTRLS